MKEKTHHHVRVRKVVREHGPIDLGGIIKETGKTKQLTYKTLERMEGWGEIKKLSNGKYVDYKYEDIEEKIREILNKDPFADVKNTAIFLGYSSTDKKFITAWGKVQREIVSNPSNILKHCGVPVKKKTS